MGFGRYAEGFELGRSPLDTRGLRLGRWKLTRYSTGEKELYDLKTDALELRNLARSPAHARTLRKLLDLYDPLPRLPGAECRVAVPSEWRLTPAESRELIQQPGEGPPTATSATEAGPDRAGRPKHDRTPSEG